MVVEGIRYADHYGDMLARLPQVDRCLPGPRQTADTCPAGRVGRTGKVTHLCLPGYAPVGAACCTTSKDHTVDPLAAGLGRSVLPASPP